MELYDVQMTTDLGEIIVLQVYASYRVKLK